MRAELVGVLKIGDVLEVEMRVTLEVLGVLEIDLALKMELLLEKLMVMLELESWGQANKIGGHSHGLLGSM